MPAGEGWCMYDDLVLAARKLRKASGGRVQKVMIIDLDVHQVTFAPTATPHSRCSCCWPAAERFQCSLVHLIQQGSGTAQWALASAQSGVNHQLCRCTTGRPHVAHLSFLIGTVHLLG